jgi:hypothetical protein
LTARHGAAPFTEQRPSALCGSFSKPRNSFPCEGLVLTVASAE